MSAPIDVLPGDHIDRVVEKLVARAPAFAVFNGIRVDAWPGETREAVTARWAEGNAARAEAWRKSPEGIAIAEEQERTRATLQAQADDLMQALPSVDLTNVEVALRWLERLAHASDLTGVVFDRAAVVATFEAAGHALNAFVGKAFDITDREIFARYIIGQCLDGLACVGAIHPVCLRFVQEWRARFGVAP